MFLRSKLTVFFDDPFWIGVFERTDGDRLEAAKIVFGSEPKDYEVYAYLLQNWSDLKFSPPVETQKAACTKINPKRMQRQVSRQLASNGAGMKARQAIKLQQETGKKERQMKSRQQRDLEEQRKFKLRQEKKKEKHKGR